MHRSGTSACTRVLNLLGCALPDALIGADDGNETGHWESIAAVDLNDKMLASAGSTWEDWGPINSDWRQSAIRDEMVGRARGLIVEHAELGPLFALKDPRLCRLADVWLEAMDAAHVEPLVVMMLRNPAEVAASLENRDLMSPGYGHLLWLRHVLDAEYLSRGRRRIVCRYDQLLSNWHAMIERMKSNLGVAFPRNSPAVQAQIDAFLTPQQRHHRENVDAVASNASLSVWLRRSFAILLAWSETGETETDHAELDAIRTEFDRSHSAFARLLLERDVGGKLGSGSQLKRELATRLAETQVAAEATRLGMADAEATLAHRAAREAELGAQIEARAAQAQQLQAEIDRLHAEAQRLGGLETEIAGLRVRDAALTTELAGLQASLQAAGEDATTWQAEVDRLRVEAQRLGDLENEILALRARAMALTSSVDDLQASLSTARDLAGADYQRFCDVEQQLDSKIVEANNQELQNAEYLGQLATARSAMVQRQEEAAQLWAQLLAAERLSGAAEATSGQERERRQAAEQRIAATEQDLAALRAQLDDARTALTVPPDNLIAEIAQLTRLLHDQEMVSNAAEQATAGYKLENARLTDQLRDREMAFVAVETARAAAEQKLLHRFDEIANLTTLLGEETGKAGAAAEQLAKLHGENARLTDQLRDRESAVVAAETARAAAELKLVHRFDEIAKLTALLGDETGKADAAEERLVRLHSEVAQLSDQLHRREAAVQAADAARVAADVELAGLHGTIDQLSGHLRQREASMQAAESARAAVEQKLANRFDEIARLTTMLADEAGKASDASSHAAWLREVVRVSETFPKWWALMPGGWRRAREHARYEQHSLFNARQYLETYPDVAQQGMDPIRHYILHGIAEGRQRSA